MYSSFINLLGIALFKFVQQSMYIVCSREMFLLHPREMKGGVNLTLTHLYLQLCLDAKLVLVSDGFYHMKVLVLRIPPSLVY